MGGPIFSLINALRDGQYSIAFMYLAFIVIILLIAFPIHELAHAVTADRLGDDTPRLAGRITLNPLKQLNWLGCVLFLVAGFGWASVPINPDNFRGNRPLKETAVALAGPAANIVLAVIFALIYHALRAFSVDVNPSLASQMAQGVCTLAVNVNLFLAFFNLIPIPPLDGSRVLLAYASDSVRQIYWNISQYAFIIFILLSRTGIFGLLIGPPVNALYTLLIGGGQ